MIGYSFSTKIWDLRMCWAWLLFPALALLAILLPPLVLILIVIGMLLVFWQTAPVCRQQEFVCVCSALRDSISLRGPPLV